MMLVLQKCLLSTVTATVERKRGRIERAIRYAWNFLPGQNVYRKALYNGIPIAALTWLYQIGVWERTPEAHSALGFVVAVRYVVVKFGPQIREFLEAGINVQPIDFDTCHARVYECMCV